jgi:hypothetical protein
LSAVTTASMAAVVQTPVLWSHVKINFATRSVYV